MFVLIKFGDWWSAIRPPFFCVFSMNLEKFAFAVNDTFTAKKSEILKSCCKFLIFCV